MLKLFDFSLESSRLRLNISIIILFLVLFNSLVLKNSILYWVLFCINVVWLIFVAVMYFKINNHLKNKGRGIKNERD